MTLGTTLRRLRDERGWSQGQLAVHSGVDQSHLSKIERDVHETINARVLARIADALNISTDYLMVEAGWLEPRPNISGLTFAESRLFSVVRQIKRPTLRAKLLEQLTWIAEAVYQAETAQELQQLTTEREKYGAGGGGDHRGARYCT